MRNITCLLLFLAINLTFFVSSLTFAQTMTKHIYKDSQIVEVSNGRNYIVFNSTNVNGLTTKVDTILDYTSQIYCAKSAISSDSQWIVADVSRSTLDETDICFGLYHFSPTLHTESNADRITYPNIYAYNPVSYYCTTFNRKKGGSYKMPPNDSLAPIFIPRRADPMIFFDMQYVDSTLFLATLSDSHKLAIWAYDPNNLFERPSDLGVGFSWDTWNWKLLTKTPIDTLSDFFFSKTNQGFLFAFAHGHCFTLTNGQKSEERRIPTDKNGKLLFLSEKNRCRISSASSDGNQLGSTEYTW